MGCGGVICFVCENFALGRGAYGVLWEWVEGANITVDGDKRPGGCKCNFDNNVRKEI